MPESLAQLGVRVPPFVNTHPISSVSTPRIIDRDVHVWAVWLHTPDSLLAQFQSVLTPDEARRANRFGSYALKRSFVLARSCLRIVLGWYAGKPAERLLLTYSTQGKPALADPNLDLRFNLSHSGEVAVFAIGRSCEIGVDVEQVRPLPDRMQIAERFFASGEIADLKDLPAGSQHAAFYRAWTRKEACVKGIGEGLSHPLHTFQVTLRPTDPAGVHDLVVDQPFFASWSLHHLSPAPGYIGALALSCDDCRVEINPIVDPPRLLSTLGK
jgi:4'-phosphopantetheinyl transferase